MPVTSQTYIDVIFASGGSVTAVPDATQGDGSVSMTQGYGANYTLAQGSPGSLNVEEVKMNYLFNLITTVLQTYQQQTIAPWIPTVANNGTPYPYSQYSLAMYTNGIAYISLVNSNTVLPGSDSTKWQPITLGTGLLAANNLSDLGTLATALMNLGFVESFGTSGYQKLPGGLIIQWGTLTTGGSGTAAATFPITFPNALYTVNVNLNEASTQWYSDTITSSSTSGCSIAVGVSYSNGTFAGSGLVYHYLAIGY